MASKEDINMTFANSYHLGWGQGLWFHLLWIATFNRIRARLHLDAQVGLGLHVHEDSSLLL